MSIAKLIQTIIFASAVLLASGCQPPYMDHGRNHGEQFAPEEKPTAEAIMLDAQVVRGAASDATLYSCHFDGANLNSLGASKLNLMLRANDGAGNLAVWMAIPDNDQAGARRMSVAAYLKDHGLAPEEIVFGRGPNPGVEYPAAKGLKDLAAMDGGGAPGASAGSSPSAASPAPGGPAAP